jgi:outer membrane usher protein
MVVLPLLLAAAVAQPAAAQLQQSFWELVINDARHGEAIALVDAAETWLPVAVLERAGLHRFEGERRVLFDELYVRMGSLEPEISLTRDEAQLVLRVFAAPRFFDQTTFTLVRDRPEGITYSHTPGVFSNYSVTWDEAAGTSGYGQTVLSMFGNTTLDVAYSVDATGLFKRGLTSLSIDKPSRRLRFLAGDMVTRATSLGSAPIMGGIQFGRDYRLDPYYYRYPSPFIRGTVTTQSEVDIYVNGSRVRQLQIGPGPYQLDRLPVNTGLSDVRVVVRDPFGREQIIDSTMYQAIGLLRPGEQDFQYSGGRIRDDSFGAPVYMQYAGTGQHRVGITGWLTAGVSGEGDENVVSGGPNLSVRFGRFGEMLVDAAWSKTRDGVDGQAFYGTYTFIGRWLNLSLTAQNYDSGYSNLFVLPDGFRTNQFAQASIGVPILNLASLTYTFEHRNSPAGSYGFVLDDGSFDEARTRVRHHILRYTMRLPLAMQLNSQARYTQVRGEHALTGFVGLTVVLGGGWATATANHVVRRDTEVEAFDINKSLPIGPGYGFRLNGSDLEGGTAGAIFEVNTGINRLRASYDVFDGGERQNGAFQLSGGIAGNGGGLFFTRPIDSSSAVVEVGGLEGVGVLVDNIPVGSTGGGKIMVNDLLPFLANRISFVEEDLPFDYKVPVSSQLVAPPYRGAAYVRFPTARIQGRAGTLRWRAGDELIVPSYGTVTVTVDGELSESPLNANGDFFLDLPDGTHTVTATFKGEMCSFTITARTGAQLVQQLGEVVCTP